MNLAQNSWNHCEYQSHFIRLIPAECVRNAHNFLNPISILIFHCPLEVEKSLHKNIQGEPFWKHWNDLALWYVYLSFQGLDGTKTQNRHELFLTESFKVNGIQLHVYKYIHKWIVFLFWYNFLWKPTHLSCLNKKKKADTRNKIRVYAWRNIYVRTKCSCEGIGLFALTFVCVWVCVNDSGFCLLWHNNMIIKRTAK